MLKYLLTSDDSGHMKCCPLRSHKGINLIFIKLNTRVDCLDTVCSMFFPDPWFRTAEDVSVSSIGIAFTERGSDKVHSVLHKLPVKNPKRVSAEVQIWEGT